MHRLIAAGRIAASLAAVSIVSVVYTTVLVVNPTTVALSYLLAILVIATGWGLVEATVASVAAVVCFNFFFLPPSGTLTIADPQNWVAFLAFFVTAIIASQLSGRARQRAIDAAARQRDLERLYALSRASAPLPARRADARRNRSAHRRVVRAADGRPLRSLDRHRIVGRHD